MCVFCISFGGAKKSLDQYGPADEAKNEDDDFDLFASDEEVEKVMQTKDIVLCHMKRS